MKKQMTKLLVKLFDCVYNIQKRKHEKECQN